MTGVKTAEEDDRAPGGKPPSVARAARHYVIGLMLAGALTGLSFAVALIGDVFWQPGVTVGLLVLAVAQIGIHLVFFLHLTTGADNANNSLAVAFGVLIIVLFGAGTLWIMSNLNAHPAPYDRIMNLHMQR